MEKETTMEEKSDALPPVDPSQSPEARAALMLLGRRANAATTEPVQKQKLTLAFLRKKILSDPDGSTSTASADDKAFLAATSVRLDLCNVRAIENLEMLDKLTHIHLQNNFIQKIDELDFVRKLQWLNLSKNQIQVIEGLSHLQSLTCLDLSANTISDIGNLASCLPMDSLRILNLYGNPVSEKDGYRASVTSSLPNLLALDGTCLCDAPEDAPGFTAEDELFGCDGVKCNARVIFGPRFVTGVKEEEEERDYCLRCAHAGVSQFVRENDGRLEGHGFVLSTDVGTSPFNNAEQGDKRAGREDVTTMLRKSAMEARVELRNIRDGILMKMRERRTQTASDAEKRMDLLKRLDDHLSKKEGRTTTEVTEGKESSSGGIDERKVQEVEEEGQKYAYSKK
jgi:hypothetical protein